MIALQIVVYYAQPFGLVGSDGGGGLSPISDGVNFDFGAVEANVGVASAKQITIKSVFIH